MTSQNNTLTSERGSALIVTMLLVSVLLMTALILLQRIVPYAKSVRSMHEASLAYYLARGQTDLARYDFLYGSGGILTSLRFPSFLGLLSATVANIGTTELSLKRGNIGNTRLIFELPPGEGGSDDIPRTPSIGVPIGDDYIVVSANNQNPLQIKLFSTDTDAKQFGTSRVNAGSHTLYSRNAGGLRFDLIGLDLSNSFALGLTPTSTLPSPPWTITLKMEYLDNPLTADSLQTFTVEYPASEFISDLRTVLTSNPETGNIQLIDTNGIVTGISGANFTEFLTATGAATGMESDIDCTSAKICSLTLILNSSISQSINFQLNSNKRIPDLNAVVIGDGLSGNGLYHQRIVEFIPTPQDI